MKTTAEVRVRLTEVFNRLEKNISELPRSKELANIAGKVISSFKVDIDRDKLSSKRK